MSLQWIDSLDIAIELEKFPEIDPRTIRSQIKRMDNRLRAV